jgi:hypothetical protein
MIDIVWNFKSLIGVAVNMPNRLSVTVVARIKDALRDPTIKITDRYIQQLASDYNTTRQTIYRHKSRIRAGSTVMSRSGGPRRIITWKMEQAIKLLLDERPWYY